MGFAGKLFGPDSGIYIYHIIGILIFMALFVVILIRTFRMKKADIIDYKTSIFDENDSDTNSPINI